MDGALAGAQARRVEAHLIRCACCRERLEHLEACRRALSGLAGEEEIVVAPDLAARIKLAARKAHEDARVREVAGTPPIGSPAFTAVCASLFIGAVVLYLGATNWCEPQHDAVMAAAAVPVRLADLENMAAISAAEPRQPASVSEDEIALVRAAPRPVAVSFPAAPSHQALRTGQVALVSTVRPRASSRASRATTSRAAPVSQRRAVSHAAKPAVLVAAAGSVNLAEARARRSSVPAVAESRAGVVSVASGGQAQDSGLVAGIVAGYLLESWVTQARTNAAAQPSAEGVENVASVPR